MQYYVIRVAARQEKKFLTMARPYLGEKDLEVFFLRKSLTHWKQGKKREVEMPLFPGYLFLAAPDLDADLYWSLKRTAGFLTFIKANAQVQPLNSRDRDLLRHFLHFGEVAGTSLIRFDENQRIQVIEGPLQGLEGRITRVDRRKQRARVSLEFHDTVFTVDLAYKDIAEATPPPVLASGRGA